MPLGDGLACARSVQPLKGSAVAIAEAVNAPDEATPGASHFGSGGSIGPVAYGGTGSCRQDAILRVSHRPGAGSFASRRDAQQIRGGWIGGRGFQRDSQLATMITCRSRISSGKLDAGPASRRQSWPSGQRSPSPRSGGSNPERAYPRPRWSNASFEPRGSKSRSPSRNPTPAQIRCSSARFGEARPSALQMRPGWRASCYVGGAK